MDKRCLVVSYYFPPSGGAGVQRIVKMIKYLSRSGWSFTIICSKGEDELQPLDHTLRTELPADLQVIALDSKLPFKNNSVLQRMPFFQRASYWKRWLIAFRYIPDMRLPWIRLVQQVIVQQLRANKFNCILLTVPPYSLAILADKLGQLTDLPIILDMRDPWSLHPYKIHPTLFHKTRDRRIELRTIAKIKHGISAYAKLLDFYRSEIKNFAINHWCFIPNGYDEEDFINLEPLKITSPKYSFNIGLSGSIHSKLNSPEPVFKALRLLSNFYPETGRLITLHHIGKSVLPLKKIAHKYNLENQLKEWGYVEHRHSLEILAAMEAFVLIHNIHDLAGDMIVGGKVYEYLRLKKPILALVPESGEAAELIRRTDSGVVIPADKTQSVAETLKTWIEKSPDFSFRGIEEFSREKQSQLFSLVLSRAAGIEPKLQ